MYVACLYNVIIIVCTGHCQIA